jgi:hypothetical protein
LKLLCIYRFKIAQAHHSQSVNFQIVPFYKFDHFLEEVVVVLLFTHVEDKPTTITKCNSIHKILNKEKKEEKEAK